MKMQPTLNPKSPKIIGATVLFIIAVYWLVMSHGQAQAYEPMAYMESSYLSAHTRSFTDQKMAEHGWRIVNFWASWCKPCREELPALDNLAKIIDELQVVTISADQDDFTLKNYWQENGWTMPGYIDKNNFIEKDIRIIGYPISVFLSPEDEIMEAYVGKMEWDDPELQKSLKDIMVDWKND